jgi:hypothetical protein
LLLAPPGFPRRDAQPVVDEFQRRGTHHVGDEHREGVLLTSIMAHCAIDLDQAVAQLPRSSVDPAHTTPEFGVALADLGVDRGRVQREPRVPMQVVEFAGARHTDDGQLVTDELRLQRTDPWKAVRTQRRQETQVASGSVPAPEDLGDVWRVLLELGPGRHTTDDRGRHRQSWSFVGDL